MNIEIDDEGNPKKDSAGKTMGDTTAEAIYNLDNMDKLAYLRRNTLFKHYYYDRDDIHYTISYNFQHYKNTFLLKLKRMFLFPY